MRKLLPSPILLGSALFVLTNLASATQAPPGYYNSVDDSNPTVLRATVHAVIDDHTRLPYTSGSADTWDCLEDAQQNPFNSSQVLDVYRNRSFTKQGGGNSFYNREHVWPRSYGFPDDNSSNYPFTDCHMLHISDDGYNSDRSNKPFDQCSSSCSENTTDSNGGMGGGSGSYPGQSNWTSGSFTNGTWEVWTGRRGDIARAMLYADVRYEGGNHGLTGASEPDLILTDSTSLINSSNTGSNLSIAYMGKLSVLLQWHAEDPVDAYEMRRNNEVANYQGNRNPFIDHPEWVDCIFNGVCTPPGPEFCNGDGGTQPGCQPCPCGNDAADGTIGGCLNSAGTSARLFVSGDANVSNDTLRFDVTGANTFTFGILASADNNLPNMGPCPPGSGVISITLDGLRCIGGALQRHGTRPSDANGDIGITTNGWGPPNGPAGGILGSSGFVAGQTRYFQVFYREEEAEVCASGQNTTNGIALTFGS